MKSLTAHLTSYAGYHRDRRNLATHFVGIPMIVLSLAILSSRLALRLFDLPISLAIIGAVAAVLFYLKLDLRFGLAMGALVVPGLWMGRFVAEQPTWLWLTVGVGAFTVGWIFQFVGHYYEGKKPAFVDDLAGLIIGPLFVAAELGFALGLRRDLQREIEAEVGPTRIRAF